MTTFPELCAACMATTNAPRLLSAGSAIAFERIARGGGATRWYFVPEGQGLVRLSRELRPGSIVSLYFDGRIARVPFDDECCAHVLDIAKTRGDAVLGRLASDGFEILVAYVSGPIELEEFRRELAEDEEVFVGPFPGRDDDGETSVTLPDADGVVRSHPH